jgi:hypothetical protein
MVDTSKVIRGALLAMVLLVGCGGTADTEESAGRREPATTATVPTSTTTTSTTKTRATSWTATVPQTPPPEPSAPSEQGCDLNYVGACVPVTSDVDCASGSGDGPYYVAGPVYVVGSDVYGLDRDGDGIGCE